MCCRYAMEIYLGTGQIYLGTMEIRSIGAQHIYVGTFDIAQQVLWRYILILRPKY